jgi:hypothetical protein
MCVASVAELLLLWVGSPADVLLIHQEVGLSLCSGCSGGGSEKMYSWVEWEEDDQVNLLLILCIILQKYQQEQNSWNRLE